MARYDVYPAPMDEGFLLDIQSNLLDGLNTRVVVPLLPVATAPKPAKTLNPRTLADVRKGLEDAGVEFMPATDGGLWSHWPLATPFPVRPIPGSTLFSSSTIADTTSRSGDRQRPDGSLGRGDDQSEGPRHHHYRRHRLDAEPGFRVTRWWISRFAPLRNHGVIPP